MADENGTGENKTTGSALSSLGVFASPRGANPRKGRLRDAEAAKGDGWVEAADAEGQTEILKQEKKTIMESIDNMARIEREIEKRMEAACEKDGWMVAVAMMPPKLAA